MGRVSNKKYRLYVMYKVLRCTMDDEDVIMLKKIYPEFIELDDTSRDADLIEACCQIADAMNVEFPSDMDSDMLSRIEE